MGIDKEYGILKNPDGSLDAKYVERLLAERDRYKDALVAIAFSDPSEVDGYDFRAAHAYAKDVADRALRGS